MKTPSLISTLHRLALLLALVFAAALSGFAANITKYSSGTDLTAAASWTGGSGPAPTAFDVALWDTGSLGSGLTLNSGTPSWLGLTVNAGASDPINIASGGTLTIGTSGVNLSASTINATIACNLSLASGYQAWSVATGKTLTLNGTLSRAAGVSMSFPTAGVTSTLLPTSNGIIGGWATVTGTGDWAATNASGNVITYAGYTSVSGTTATSATQNWKNTAAATVSATGTINSLNQQFDFTVAAATTLTLGSGGLILGGTERWLIAGSTTTSIIKSGLASGELFIHANTATFANGFQIQPVIQNGSVPTAVIKDGSGQCLMGNGGNTFSGGFYLNAGSVYLGASSTGSGSSVTSGPLGIGTVTLNGGTLYLYGRNNTTTTAAGYTLANNINIPAGASATINNGGLTGVMNGNVVSGGGSITFQGTGTTVFEGTNSYGGGTTISAGTLGVGNVPGTNNNLGTGAVAVSGGTLRVGYGVTSNQNKTYTTNNITLAGTIYEDDAFQHFAGPINITGASTLGSTYNGGGADADKGLYLDGVVSGSSALTVQISHYDSAHNYDTAYVVFTNNANTYSGTITINENSATTEGGVYVGVNGSLALSNATLATAAIPGATLRFGTSPIVFKTGLGSATLGAISGSGPLVLAGYDSVGHAYTGGGSIALTVGGNNSTTTYSGAISGANGSLIKTGSGTLTLSGANTYTGPTTVSAGSLFLTSPLNSIGAVTMNSAATLADTGTNNGDVYLVSGAVLVPGGSNAVSTLTITTNSPSALTLNGNVIVVDLSSTNGISDLIALTGASGTLVLNGANTISLSFPNNSAPVGTYTLMTYAAKTGSGTLALDHAYPNVALSVGATSVTLTVSAGGTAGSYAWKGDGTANAWDTSTANWLPVGATTPTTYIDTYFPVIFDNTGSNTPAVNITPGAVSPLSVTVNSINNYTIGGAAITGTAPLTKSGSGTLTLTGNNSFSGASTISGGTVIAGSTTALGTTAGGVTLSGGSTLDMQTDGGDNAYNINIGSGNTVAVNSDVKTGSVGINHTLGTLALGNSTLNLNKGPNVASGSPAITFGAVNLSAGVGGIAIINPTNVGVTLASASIALNNSAKTLQLDGTSANNSVAGVIANGLNTVSLTKANTGTWTLSGANTYTGPTTVSGGILALTGSGAISSTAAGATFLIGTVSGTPAAVYQSGASTAVTAQPTGGAWNLGNVAGALGYYNLSAGTMTIQNGGEFDPAGNTGGVGTFGQFDMSGGTFTVGTSGTGVSYFLPNRGAAGESSVVNISGGTVSLNPSMTESATFGGFEINWGAGSQTNVTTISGNATFTSPSESIKLNQANNAANLCSLNLNGGLLQTLGFTAAHCASAVVNFNGGTLKAGSAGNGSFFGNVAFVYIYGGGATIDNNSQAITCNLPLLTVAGNGVATIPVATGGAGYIVPPQVFITGGGGSNATAYAQISGAGAVTNIVISNPGMNYSSLPTVTLSPAGATSAATLGTVTTSANNTSGGVTFNGTAQTTLTAVNTYTGDTVISNGTVALTGTATLPTSVKVAVSGAVFDVSGLTTLPFTVSAGKTLSGIGSVKGSVAMASTSTLAPGNSVGTLTFRTNLTLNAGSTNLFELSTSASGANDQVLVGGTLTNNGSTIYITATSGAANLDQTTDYVLFYATNGITGALAATPIFLGTAPANAAHYTVGTSGNTIVLHYNSNIPPTGTGSASPSSVVRNQTTTITVIATPGSDPVSTVTLNASPIGGSSAVSLVLSNANVYTNTFTVGASAAVGSQTLVATITDTSSGIGSANVSLTVNATAEVWDGGAADNNVTSSTNWVSDLAPGFVGDSLAFDGTTRLTPNLDTNYSVTALTFNSGAGSFVIGTANGSTLTLTGGVTNNSASTQTLNVPVAMSASQTFNTAAGNLTFGSVVSGSGGLTKTGNNVLTLSGTNTFTGGATVSAGTLNVSGMVGPVASTSLTTVGNAANKAVLNVSGVLNQKNLLVGNASGAVGVVYQTGGTVTVTNGGGDCMSVGNIAGGFGYYNLSAGSVLANGLAVGGENNNGSGFSGTGGTGVMDIAGGTLNDIGWVVLARGTTTETGVLNIFGGTLNYAGGGIVNCWGTGGQIGIVNVMGGVVSNSTDVGFNLNQSGNATNTGVLNLNGGVTRANGIIGGSARVNFNGGTLKASKATTAFISGISSVNIYAGGATIDDGGFAVTNAQPLLAPTTNGVNGIASFTAGAGYIAPPIITVVRGGGDTTGVGATAIAQIDMNAGTVTNVVITCPGVNYTATPTFSLAGGGATSAATITGTAPTANTSGGLTKNGVGTLTLSGMNTFTGDVNVNAGTLSANAVNNLLNPTSSALGNPQAVRNINVNNGGTLTFVAGDTLGSADSTVLATLVINSNGVVNNAGNNFTTFGPIQLNGGTLTGTGGAISGYQMYNLLGTVSVAGSSDSTISGSGANAGYHLNTATTFDVASGRNLNLSGTLIDRNATLGGAGGLTKTGNGTLTLTGVNTYTGTTTVSGGTLRGTGTIAGPVTVSSGGTFAPGTTALGTFTVNSTLSLAGNVNFRVNKTGGTLSSDRVAGATAVTAGGALSVTVNGGSDAFADGNTFTLFNLAPTGTFSATNLPAFGTGTNWWTTNNYATLTVNVSPVAGAANYTRAKGVSLKIAISDLLTNVTGAISSKTITLTSVGASTNGATITTNGTYIFYTPANDNNESFSYSVSDGRGGSATGIINLSVASAVSGNLAFSLAGSTATINGFGVPGYTYVLQTTTNLSTPWWTILTNTAAGDGTLNFTDPDATNAQQYYRTAQP